jgi:chitinase
VRRTRSLIAVAGTALLAVAGIAAVAAQHSPRPVRVSQVANVSVDSTAALADNWYASAPYYSVLDSAGPDLEEPEIENAAAIANELGAAQIPQRNNPGLFVSITMPSIATGANYFGQQLLNEAQTLGFTPNDYTIMPFDGGFNGGSSQVSAL